MNDAHFRALEQMYLSVPLNNQYEPSITVGEQTASIVIAVKPFFLHALGVMHGMIYFKMLDDACAFAAASAELSKPMVTASLTIDFMRPVTEGTLSARGRVVRIEGRKHFTEATLVDDKGATVAKAHALFLPAKMTYDDVPTYQLA